MPNTWYKVDNVAKVFLASVTRRDPRVFRISCTLTEDIDPDALAAALQRTAGDLPNFQVTLHRGLFWHYLEASGKCPRPEPEHRRPCAAIYGRDIKNELLYRVSYYGARINVEMFHALSDGNGGLLFLKVLVHNYLALRHPDELEGVARDEGASAADMAEDSFQQFYARRKAAFAPADPAARRPVCRLHGRRLPLDQTQFFEGHLPVKDVLAKARALGVTLTSYLAAAQMLAVWQETPALERGRAIAVGLPVNLRNYFPSDTARNFFNTIRVAHVFTGDETLDGRQAEGRALARAHHGAHGRLPAVRAHPRRAAGAAAGQKCGRRPVQLGRIAQGHVHAVQHGAGADRAGAGPLYQGLCGLLQQRRPVHHGLLLRRRPCARQRFGAAQHEHFAQLLPQPG